MSKFCKNCGAEIPAEGKFCGVCGTPAVVEPEAEVEAVPAVVEEPVIPAISMDEEPVEIVVEPAKTEIEPMEATDPEPVVMPQVEAPVDDVAPKKETTKKAKEKPPVGKGILARRGAFRGILAVLLCVVIFVCSFAALTMWNVGYGIAGGITSFVIDEDMVESILKDNKDALEATAGMKLSNDDIAQMAKQIMESVEGDAITLEALEALSPEAAQGIKIVVGVVVGIYLMVVLVFVLITIILCTILGAINRSILRSCRDIGVTLMVAGGVWGIVGLFPIVLPDLLADMVSDAMAAELLGNMLQKTLLGTAVVFGTGLILVLIKVIGKPIAAAVARRA